MKRGFLTIIVGTAAVACIALWLWWPRVLSTPVPDRESAGRVEVTLPLPASVPAPSEPAPPLAPDRPAPAEPMVAALPPAPGAVPVTPPEPILVDRRTIARVQFHLEQLGYQVGAADGALGRRTKAAISAFRAVNGLARGEEVDAALVDALDLAVRQLPKGKPADGVPAAAPRIPVVSAPLSGAPP